MKTLLLTEQQLECLAEALQWVDAAGDYSELFEGRPRRFYRMFLAVKTKIDALR